MTEVRFPAEEKDFSFSLCVQTSSEAHPACYAMGTGIKRGHGMTLNIHLIWLSSKISRVYISSLPCRLHGGGVTAFDFLFIVLYNNLLTRFFIFIFILTSVEVSDQSIKEARMLIAVTTFES
jgi:hypothetical protein